ncbi:MAG: cell wall hydrolase [Kiritimatiellaeota bacterium]|nr:cell wall hydrolase [Kiritimatiellota bacterium]
MRKRASIVAGMVAMAVMAAEPIVPPTEDTQWWLLARLAYGEGGSDNPEDKYAIASTVINRVNYKGYYANTVHDVVYAKTSGGGYEYNAIGKPKWKVSENAATLRQLTAAWDINEWNMSVEGARKALREGPLPRLNGATVFHSDEKTGKQPMPGQISARYWTWRFEYTTIAKGMKGHYYFTIAPHNAAPVPAPPRHFTAKHLALAFFLGLAFAALFAVLKRYLLIAGRKRKPRAPRSAR